MRGNNIFIAVCIPTGITVFFVQMVNANDFHFHFIPPYERSSLCSNFLALINVQKALNDITRKVWLYLIRRTRERGHYHESLDCMKKIPA